MGKIMCAGTFDMIHEGHLYLLSEAKKFGDELIVVIARDSNSEKAKGKKPKFNEKERLERIRSLKIVDRAVLGRQGNIFDIIDEIKPDIICLGYDQKVQKEELEDELRKRNMKAQVVRISPYMPDVYKTSKMLK